LTISEILSGIIFAATETTPFPPMEIIGTVKESSPDRTQKFSGHKDIILLTCSRLPLASLIPTIFLISESFATVSGSIDIPVLEGTL